jgi:uncharacterized spore protein YtfJ
VAKGAKVKVGAWERLLNAVQGARVCYGEPVTTAGRTVIPVARLRAYGGGGWGRGNMSDESEGGGGGGFVDAQPIGFIELGPGGARYEAIPDPEQLGRTLKAGAAALTTLAAGLAGAQRLRRRRRPHTAGLLGR